MRFTGRRTLVVCTDEGKNRTAGVLRPKYGLRMTGPTTRHSSNDAENAPTLSSCAPTHFTGRRTLVVCTDEGKNRTAGVLRPKYGLRMTGPTTRHSSNDAENAPTLSS